jgi:DNA-binding transcriptional MerR regulator
MSESEAPIADGRKSRILTPEDLARELGVSLPTIRRAVCRGLIVPTFRTTGGRARFDRPYADELKRRADAVRATGAIRVLKALASPEAPDTPDASATPSASAWSFARQTAWKRTHLA